MSVPPRLFVTDCEGPLTRNDNALSADLGEQRLALALSGGHPVGAQGVSPAPIVGPQVVPVRPDDGKRTPGHDRAAVELGSGQVDHGAGLACVGGQQSPDDVLPGALRPAR